MCLCVLGRIALPLHQTFTGLVHGLSEAGGVDVHQDGFAAQRIELFRAGKRIEDCPFGDPEARGQGGPIPVMRMPSDDPISAGFIECCQEMGLPKNEDYNAGSNDGVACQQFNIKQG